jgi:hypothetical protein
MNRITWHDIKNKEEKGERKMFRNLFKTPARERERAEMRKQLNL